MEYNETLMLILCVGGGLILLVAGWFAMDTPLERYYSKHGKLPEKEKDEL